MRTFYQHTRSRTLKAALDYARRGIPVFPLKPGGKEPLTPRGFCNATTDPSRITAWWNRWPDANIGIPTGKRSGLLAIDIDQPASLEALETEYGEMTATATTATGNGGMHYLYRYPASVEIRNSASKLGEGLDVRGEGGYIVAPPSRTTRPYEWLDKRPLADPPTWLMKGLTGPERAVSREVKATTAPVSVERVSETIPVGARNATLTRIAGRLHDGTRDQAELEEELLAINGRRCAKPLPEAEVLKIARWVFGKPPCMAGRREDPEVAEILDRAGQYWYARLVPGGGTSKLRDVYRALIEFGARHGEIATVMVAGEERRAVRVSASCRQVAPEAGTTPMSVSRNTKRLRRLGAIRKDDAGRHEAHGGTFLIIEPAHQRYTHNNPSPSSSESSVGEGCNTRARPPRPDRLRTPAPRWGDHIGNARAGTLYALEAFGPQTEEVLAKRVGVRRARDFVRRHLRPLARLGLVEKRGDAWVLTPGYGEKTGELRRAPYSTVRRVRRRYRTPEGRVVTELVEIGAVASVEDRDRMAREHYADEREGYRNRHRRPAATQPVSDRAPHGEVGELERLPRADQALVAALRAYLDRNPWRRGEMPSWLAVALWADGHLPGKPPPAEVELALLVLGDAAVA